MRQARIKRDTLETQIDLGLDLDGRGVFKGSSGLGFFDHMLTLLAKHGGLDLDLEARGDLEVDSHHLIEDLGISLGLALDKALGDKRGIARYGSFTCPMDEALTTVNLDLSGRGYLVFKCQIKRDMVGDLETEMLKEFLYALAINGKVTLHVNNHYGDNDHHKIESIFKALGRALKEAVRVQGDDIPSTKGVLA